MKSDMYDVVFKTLLDTNPLHPVLEVTYQGTETNRYCGDSWCSGKCGLPALVTFDNEGNEMKAHSNMVSVGRVFQLFRVPWTGGKESLPEEFRDSNISRMYF